MAPRNWWTEKRSMRWAEKIHQTGTESMPMAQGYGNYPPYAKNPILIKMCRGAECPARHCFLPALIYIGPVFLDLPAFIFWLDRKGVWTDLFVHKTVRVEARSWKYFGRHRLDHRIAMANFTLMLIHILFCREYEASTIILAHVQYTKWGLPGRLCRDLCPPIPATSHFRGPSLRLSFHTAFKDLRNDDRNH